VILVLVVFDFAVKSPKSDTTTAEARFSRLWLITCGGRAQHAKILGTAHRDEHDRALERGLITIGDILQTGGTPFPNLPLILPVSFVTSWWAILTNRHSWMKRYANWALAGTMTCLSDWLECIIRYVSTDIGERLERASLCLR
jgi:hypothetical protein